MYETSTDDQQVNFLFWLLQKGIHIVSKNWEIFANSFIIIETVHGESLLNNFWIIFKKRKHTIIYLEKFTRQIEKKISLKRFGRIKLKYLFAPPFLDDVKGDLRIEKISEDTFTNVNQFPTVESFYDDESIQLVNDLFSEDLPCVDIGK